MVNWAVESVNTNDPHELVTSIDRLELVEETGADSVSPAGGDNSNANVNVKMIASGDLNQPFGKLEKENGHLRKTLHMYNARFGDEAVIGDSDDSIDSDEGPPVINTMHMELDNQFGLPYYFKQNINIMSCNYLYYLQSSYSYNSLIISQTVTGFTWMRLSNSIITKR